MTFMWGSFSNHGWLSAIFTLPRPLVQYLIEVLRTILAQSRTVFKFKNYNIEYNIYVSYHFCVFISGSIDLPVNSDAVTRAELRRTRLDLIRREYEVNRMTCTCTLSARLMRTRVKFSKPFKKPKYAILSYYSACVVQCDLFFHICLTGQDSRW